MPLPKPEMGETTEEFISRCMSDEKLNEEFPDTEQRLAVCNSQAESETNELSQDSNESKEARIKIGDFVQLDIGPATEIGKVMEKVCFGTIKIPNSERVLEGSVQDPALIIRLYDMNFHNRLVATDTITGRHSSEVKKIEAHRLISDETGDPSIPNDSMEEMSSEIRNQTKEFKDLPFKITEVHEEKSHHNKESNIGIVKGLASTFGNVDRGNDRIMKGAFGKSIDRYKGNSRPIKMFYQHNSHDIIGGFPSSEIKETDKGLEVTGHINLDVQKGREAYALAKQGVLTDFSIGYTVGDYAIKEDGIRDLKEIELWEISLVGEPMNQLARVTDVKRATSFQDLPLAPRETEWDSTGAVERIREFTDSQEEPNEQYRRAFMWFNQEEPRNFTSYKLPYADVIDGQLRAVPRAIFAIAAALEGARGGVDIPEEDRSSVISHVERYYEKMDMQSPFNEESSTAQFYEYKDVLNISNKKEFEKTLRDSGRFSRKAATYLASFFNEYKQSDSVLTENQYNELKSLIKKMRG